MISRSHAFTCCAADACSQFVHHARPRIRIAKSVFSNYAGIRYRFHARAKPPERQDKGKTWPHTTTSSPAGSHVSNERQSEWPQR